MNYWMKRDSKNDFNRELATKKRCEECEHLQICADKINGLDLETAENCKIYKKKEEKRSEDSRI